ncbi:hypothetical protein CCMSSC00406_0003991 [Pleurotus cornucopiae]|uniref:Uncharacterized protein n=1 Tax=Pleurotus cornucopiae TaxID=5321 RepID=A0ACB7IQZ3_PLECO|nr:hypothetical protein CCMSSC00406_0003991 [Pleurotus cornucopiae]
MMSLLNPPRLPPKDARKAVNPIKAMRALTWTQQAIFWSGWFAWVADSFDFFCVSLTILRFVSPEMLQEQFGESTHAMTTAITLTLLLRPVGAFIVGLLADRFGRKWPLVGVLLVIAALQIITSFMTTFSRFLAVRSLYGIAMGGVWARRSWRRVARVSRVLLTAKIWYSEFPGPGTSAISVLCPSVLTVTKCELKLHILVIIASPSELYQNNDIIRVSSRLLNLLLVPNTPQTWRSIFWFGAGLSVLAASIRASLPEGAVFKRSREVARRENMTAVDKAVVFTHSLGRMFKDHWTLWVYGVVFISGLQFLAHSSQDLYTTFMQASKGFSASLANEANIIGEAGALIGGALGGYLSQFLGRKITVVFACVWSAAFIPLWMLPSSWGRLSIGAFFFQVGVNIAWGMLVRIFCVILGEVFTSIASGAIAIHLNELAPPAFRGAFTGTVHQMGNMASSASAQIIAGIRSLFIPSRLSNILQATAGITLRKQVNGVDQPDYGTIQAIMAALSCAMVIICTFFGPERHSAHFEDGRTAIEEGVAHKDRTSSYSGEGEGEKVTVEYIEHRSVAPDS